MAASVVAETGAQDYTDKLRSVFARHPVYLIAGERSRDGWDVPDWAVRDAASFAVIPDAGHMMMLEQPEAFGRG